jgi:hypothetical protein
MTKGQKLLPLLLAVLVLPSLVGNAYAQFDSDGDGLTDTEEDQLATTYAPTLQFAGGEEFFPVEVEYFLNDAALYAKVGDESVLVDSDPSLEILSQTQGDYFLTAGSPTYDSVLDRYTSDRAIVGYRIYSRVSPVSSGTIVQYWFFYVYNLGALNEHEGDWEVIEIQLDFSGVPAFAAYSQHHAGQRTVWENVETVDETHPIVYVALGSHANYFRAHQGNLGIEGDEVNADGFSLSYSAIEVEVLGEFGSGRHAESQDWLEFGGRWGNWEEEVDAARGLAGPFGPAWGENSVRWQTPSVWGLSLRPVDSVWFTMSFLAANALYVFLGLVLILVALKGRKIVGLMRRGGLRVGLFLRARSGVGISLAVLALILYGVAIFSPWYIVMGDLDTQAVSTEGAVEILRVGGNEGV